MTDPNDQPIAEARDRYDLIKLQARDADLPGVLADRILSSARYEAVLREIGDVRVSHAELFALISEGITGHDTTPPLRRPSLISDDRADTIRELVAGRVELDALETASHYLTAAIAVQHTQEPTG